MHLLRILQRYEGVCKFWNVAFTLFFPNDTSVETCSKAKQLGSSNLLKRWYTSSRLSTWSRGVTRSFIPITINLEVQTSSALEGHLQFIYKKICKDVMGMGWCNGNWLLSLGEQFLERNIFNRLLRWCLTWYKLLCKLIEDCIIHTIYWKRRVASWICETKFARRNHKSKI